MALSTVKATINGVEHSLSYNAGSGKWEATITAPGLSSFNKSGGYYDVGLEARDTAGNVATANASSEGVGTNLRLVVVEKVKPTIVVTSPGEGSVLTSNTPTITAQLRDNDSGIDISSLSLKIDGGSAITQGSAGMTTSLVSGGYDITYIPQTSLSDGPHAITITVKDHDGNIANLATRNVSIDTVPPSLNVSSPLDNFETNNSSGTVAGTTNDATSSPVSVTITVNGVSVGAVTVSGEGAFSKAVTYTEGSNTVVITATDGAGRQTVVTRTVILDTKIPVFTSVAIAPNPVDAGATYVISVVVND